MEKEKIESLFLIKKNTCIESKLAKISILSEKVQENEGIKEKYYLLKAIISSIDFIVTEEIEKRKLKHDLARILGCDEKDIVYDENELSKNENAMYIAGDIRYSATIDKKTLINKKIILGDLDIRALRDTRCLENLEIVGGDLLLAEDAYLPNLKYVLSSVYGKNLSKNNFPNLKFAQNVNSNKVFNYK